MSKHCVSLPIAKELKEAGFPQTDSTFYWCQAEGGEWELLYEFKVVAWAIVESISAPTVGELGEALPSIVNGYMFHSMHIGSQWWFGYWEPAKVSPWLGDVRYETKTEVEGKAKMWLWLKKEGHIKQ